MTKTSSIKNTTSNYPLQRALSLNKPSSLVKLPKLQQNNNRTQIHTQQKSTSPVKQQSPLKSSILRDIKSQKFDKLSILPQEIVSDVPYSETVSCRAWAVYASEPLRLLKGSAVCQCRVQLQKQKGGGEYDEDDDDGGCSQNCQAFWVGPSHYLSEGDSNCY